MIIAALALAAQSVTLPRYRAKDAFVFSDGRVERVINVRKDRVVWSGLSGPSYERSRNFVVPVEAWRSREGVGRRTIVGKPNVLWPVAKSRSVRFRVVTQTKTKAKTAWRRSVTLWTCKSMRPRSVTLNFGKIDTIPFKCDRFSATNMRPLERLEWDYSPEIGHYVRRSSVDYLRGTRRTIDLVAQLSGPAASRSRLAALSRQQLRSGKKRK